MEVTEELPKDVLEAAEMATSELLPMKSRDKYERTYDIFEKWCQEKGVKTVKEEVLLAYFVKLNKEFSPNTLWAKCSTLKTVLKVKKNMDINLFYKLQSFIKKQNVGFKPKKASIFSKEDISTFINDSPDDIYLLMKVAIILGLLALAEEKNSRKYSQLT
ncbi:hypothetical protein NQ317_003984 [Molorchus minor]|uniref:Uncharacterized protein n=1 Tax=Molorchus minor TaxID=1323400 RepID=A0ABQ9K2V1_9CUCU|nr:hypothetical protein NQ317_003984 [Molorchus minor]